MAIEVKKLRTMVMVMALFVLKLRHHGGFAEPQVPCYFIFGDSLVDNGNNNNLVTLAKANYLPYGIDFSDGPTGRFCNGMTTVDVITELLGFEDYIPSYAKERDQDILKFRGMGYASAAAAELLGLGNIIRPYIGIRNNILKGVNYGSGGSGILDESGKTQGGRFSMNAQLLHHKNIVRRIALLLGGKDAAEEYLNTCLYSVTIGSNDYVNNYFLPEYYASSLLYTTDQFAEILVQQYSTQLQSLYNYGARKVVLFGVGQIGYTPVELEAHSSGDYPTVYDMNDAAELFNVKLKPLVKNLNSNLTGAKFTFINGTGMSTAASLGMNYTTIPCCLVGSSNYTCEPYSIPCPNRKAYVFMDNIHPTEGMNLYIGRAYYNASATDAYPYNIAQLAQL